MDLKLDSIGPYRIDGNDGSFDILCSFHGVKSIITHIEIQHTNVFPVYYINKYKTKQTHVVSGIQMHNSIWM